MFNVGSKTNCNRSHERLTRPNNTSVHDVEHLTLSNIVKNLSKKKKGGGEQGNVLIDINIQ